jgi:NTE family protein
MRAGEPFTLALGGGGGRGWAHIGVARALEAAQLRPSLIVGTSMGAIVGAGIAAGFGADRMLQLADATSVYRLVGRRARFALFDSGPLLEALDETLGRARIEELPTPLAITAYDLVAGRPAAITSGPVVDALRRSIAVPLFFPPCRDADGVWCDAGPWEAVPVSVARGLAPRQPVIGVWVDRPKPSLLAARPMAALLRAVAAGAGRGAWQGDVDPLTARRYFALLTRRWADPVHHEEPDLLIRPRLGPIPAWRFSQARLLADRGHRDAAAVLASAGLRPMEARKPRAAHAA